MLIFDAMKNLILITITMFAFSGVHCQTKLSTTEKANFNRLLNKGIETFNAGRLNEALETFKKAEAIDPEAWKLNYWLAMSHYDLNSYYTAERYIINAVKGMGENDEGDAAFYELQGKINHRLGKVEEASLAYKKCAILMGNKMAKEYGITEYINQSERMIQANKQGIKSMRKPLSNELNSLEDEYAPILINNGEILFFTARRPETTGETTDPDDSRFFEDVYRANWNPLTNDYEIDYEFFKSINTTGFDALSYINSTGTYALMTVNTDMTEKTTKGSDIFEISSEQAFVWDSPSIIKRKGLNTDFFEGSATATEAAEAGDFIVFISDRNSEASGLDLFTCTRSDAGFGEVTALPKNINSLGNETTPFLSPDGKYLFFSSDELPGYGGYDIFYCINENGKWSDPVNIGPEINTVNNDTHFNINFNTKKAVFASLADRDNYFSYDLFSADLSEKSYPFLK
jgi:tetratricopeptide (TPR) repeat protein